MAHTPLKIDIHDYLNVKWKYSKMGFTPTAIFKGYINAVYQLAAQQFMQSKNLTENPTGYESI